MPTLIGRILIDGEIVPPPAPEPPAPPPAPEPAPPPAYVPYNPQGYVPGPASPAVAAAIEAAAIAEPGPAPAEVPATIEDDLGGERQLAGPAPPGQAIAGQPANEPAPKVEAPAKPARVTGVNAAWHEVTHTLAVSLPRLGATARRLGSNLPGA